MVHIISQLPSVPRQTSDLGGDCIGDSFSIRPNQLQFAPHFVMTAVYANQLISVQPNDLKFLFELDKPSFCNLQLTNNTDVHVAFKVKTTSPKKYFVRPNIGVVMPRDSCIIRVTLQAQREFPPDMQCKDKFLLQSTIVPLNNDVDDLPADTFNKDGTKEIQERKLKVFYESPSGQANSEDGGLKSFTSQTPDGNSTIQHLKDERNAAVRQSVQLQQEVDFLKRQRRRRNNTGFSFMFASFVGLIGLMIGFLLNLSSTSSSTE